jgi:hypothetical protein
MFSKKTLFGVIFLLLCLHVGRVTSAETRSFTVHFAGCTEFVGWGPVSLAEAQPLVPAGYVIGGAAKGQAAIVVRATSCQGVSGLSRSIVSAADGALSDRDQSGRAGRGRAISTTTP